jgi:hypothetical protein
LQADYLTLAVLVSYKEQKYGFGVYLDEQLLFRQAGLR